MPAGQLRMSAATFCANRDRGVLLLIISAARLGQSRRSLVPAAKPKPRSGPTYTGSAPLLTRPVGERPYFPLTSASPVSETVDFRLP